MKMSLPAEQRAAMAAHNNLSLEEFDRQLEEQLAFVRAQAGSMNYGVLRNKSLAHMQSQAEVLPSQAWAGKKTAPSLPRLSARWSLRRPRRSRVRGGHGRPGVLHLHGRRRGGGLGPRVFVQRGSGFAHISCLARQANIQFGQHLAANQRSNDTRDVFLRWVDCRLCEQTFHGPVAKAMARACVSTYASRSPGDGVRISVMNALATHLPADEAVFAASRC